MKRLIYAFTLLVTFNSLASDLTEYSVNINGVIRVALQSMLESDEIDEQAHIFSIKATNGNLCRGEDGINVGVWCSNDEVKEICTVDIDSGKFLGKEAIRYLLAQEKINQLHFHSHFIESNLPLGSGTFHMFTAWDVTQPRVFSVHCTSTSNRNINLSEVNEHLGHNIVTKP